MRAIYYRLRAKTKFTAIKLLRASPLRDKVNLMVKLTRYNNNLTIPIIYGIGYTHLLSFHEPWMVHVLKRLTTWKKGALIDIGVNIGQTLIKYKFLVPNGRYFGFEVNPECFLYLRSLVKANNFEDVKLIPVGISEKTELGELDFFYDVKTDAGASLLRNLRPNNDIYRREYVPVYSWADIKRHIDVGNIAIVKIDVEGLELEVLRSIRLLIEDQQVALIFEMLPISNNHEQSALLSRQESIIYLLNELGYELYLINKSSHNDYVSVEKITKIRSQKDRTMRDYISVPKSDSDSFERIMNN